MIGINEFCARCGTEIKQGSSCGPPVVKVDRRTGHRVDFHAICWRLIAESSADRAEERERRARLHAREERVAAE